MRHFRMLTFLALFLFLLLLGFLTTLSLLQIEHLLIICGSLFFHWLLSCWFMNDWLIFFFLLLFIFKDFLVFVFFIFFIIKLLLFIFILNISDPIEKCKLASLLLDIFWLRTDRWLMT